MQRKVPSAIANITLNRATFTDVLIDGLTFVNFFYGNNGAGKSSIAHAIAEDDGVVWADGKTVDDFDVLVYNQDLKKLENYQHNQPVYEAIIAALKEAVSDEIYLSPAAFMPVLTRALANVTADKKLLEKIADGLSAMDKSAEIQRDRKGNILYDKETKDTEIVKWEEDIKDYMAREVLPHIPDAQWFFEENLGAKKPVVKTGAEIPFTRYFYKYQQPVPSEELEAKFMELELSVSKRVTKLFE